MNTIKINMSRKIYLSLSFLLFCMTGNAQDKIIKINGDTIRAKIMEIGTNGISYKKTTMLDGPTYTELKSDIRLIILSNGTTEYFTLGKSQNPADNGSASTSPVTAQNKKNKIELYNYYFINDHLASQKEVDKLLAQSNNPAITLPLKAAKAAKMSQKIIKITSYPTTIGGGIASLATGVNFINDIRRGRDNTATYVGFFSSILGTISLPITNKIMAKKTNKMYSKLIAAYNITN